MAMEKTNYTSSINLEWIKAIPILSEEIIRPKNAIKIDDFAFNGALKRLQQFLVQDLQIFPLNQYKTFVDSRAHIFLKKDARFVSKKEINPKLIINFADKMNKELSSKKHFTVLELFYLIGYFHQKYPNPLILLDHLYLLLGLLQIRLTNLNIVAIPYSNCSGLLLVKDGEYLIDLTKMGTGSYRISPLFERISLQASHARFILYSTAFQIHEFMNQIALWKSLLCLIASDDDTSLTKKEYNLDSLKLPTYLSGEFIKKIVTQFQIPVFVFIEPNQRGIQNLLPLIQGDPYGIETPWCVINNLYWIRIDLEEFQELKHTKPCFIPDKYYRSKPSLHGLQSRIHPLLFNYLESIYEKEIYLDWNDQTVCEHISKLICEKLEKKLILPVYQNMILGL